MTMIQERYVSLEIAKLLKEKGFDEPCRSYFIDDTGDYRRCAVEITNKHCSFEELLRPTLYMAMEWLRDTYHIHIIIELISGKGYNGIMCDVGDFDDFNYISETDFFLHPEEAIEAALKHALKNLI